MSRGGRPSERAKREPPKRNLIGPDEILKRIQASGGVPDKVLEELIQPKPRSERTEAANEAVVEMIRRIGGTEHEGSADPARAMAWTLSVTHSMKESVPRKKRCRHIRAADPHVTEVRTMAVLSSGIWNCVECMRQAGPSILGANLWPEECDLCGAKMEPGGFNEMAFNLPGCFVNCTVCNRCASFPDDDLDSQGRA